MTRKITIEEIREKVKKQILEASEEMVERLTEKIYGEVKELWVEEKPPIDPYLQPGWPCEVWDNTEKKALLMYYYGVSDTRQWWLGHKDYARNDSSWKHYHPIGTEWDFAPEFTTHITIDSDGMVRFYNNKTAYEIRGNLYFTPTVLPKEYYGQTIQRPEWAN